MLKMMKLDWRSTKHYRARFLIIPVCLLLIGYFSTIYLLPMGVFLLFSCSVDPFAIEEKCDLNRLYLTLPVKRRQVVLGRYLLSFIFFVTGEALGLALMPLANQFSHSKWYPDMKWSLALISFGFLFYALLSLFMYPVLFKLGYQKGKIWGYYIPAALVCLLYIIVMEYDHYVGGKFITNLLIYASEHSLTVTCGISGAGAAALAFSCFLSLKIYSRREF